MSRWASKSTAVLTVSGTNIARLVRRSHPIGFASVSLRNPFLDFFFDNSKGFAAKRPKNERHVKVKRKCVGQDLDGTVELDPLNVKSNLSARVVGPVNARIVLLESLLVARQCLDGDLLRLLLTECVGDLVFHTTSRAERGRAVAISVSSAQPQLLPLSIRADCIVVGPKYLGIRRTTGPSAARNPNNCDLET